MQIQQPEIEAFANHLKNLGKSASTVESYTRDARRFHQYLKINRSAGLEANQLLAYQDYLRSKNEKENSIRRSVIGIRQFFRYLTEVRGKSFSSPFDEVPIPTRLESTPHYLTTKNIDSLLELCEQNPNKLKASRDKAIISLLAFEGLKASELIGCEWSDFIQSTAKQASLHIRGDRHRVVSLSAKTSNALIEYRAQCKNLAPEFRKKMFISFKGRDAALPLPAMSRHGLKFMLSEIAQQTNLKKLNSELLRYYAISRMNKEGHTTADIMAHLGLKRLGNIAKVFNLQVNRSAHS